MMADPDATIELPDEVAVVNIGLALFADAVRDQSTAVEQVDWRIPADGQLDLVKDLECLYGERSTDLDVANAEVVRRLDESVPLLVDVAPSRNVVPGMSDRMLLHCGPAIEWSDVSDPLRRSMRAAAVSEGWAQTVEEADRILADGTVTLQPGVPTRHGPAHGDHYRPLGAGLCRRQPRRWHPGVRADQPGTG